MPPTMRPRPDVIRRLRLSNEHKIDGETLRELASRAGIDAATLYRIEEGRSFGRPATLRAIADALGVHVSVIAETGAQPEAVAS